MGTQRKPPYLRLAFNTSAGILSARSA